VDNHVDNYLREPLGLVKRGQKKGCEYECFKNIKGKKESA